MDVVPEEDAAGVGTDAEQRSAAAVLLAAVPIGVRVLAARTYIGLRPVAEDAVEVEQEDIV